jgi:hypothetical protein
MNQFQIKIGAWSVVRTADGKGLSIKPMEVNGLHDYEVVVTVGDGDFHPDEKSLRINTYIDGVDEPVMNVNLPKVVREDEDSYVFNPDTQEARGFVPPSSLDKATNLTDMINEIKIKQTEEYKKAKATGIDLMLNRKISKPKRAKKAVK